MATGSNPHSAMAAQQSANGAAPYQPRAEGPLYKSFGHTKLENGPYNPTQRSPERRAGVPPATKDLPLHVRDCIDIYTWTWSGMERVITRDNLRN